MTIGGSLREHGPLLLAVAVLAAGTAWLTVERATDTAPSTGGDLFERVDAYVEDQLADSRIPGAAIAVVRSGGVVHQRGFGTDGRGATVDEDTPFWIGSNTKSVTALAVMQLAEAGLVDLDAPVGRYLPDFRVADPAASAAITVRHLLNQTSGISRLDGLKAVARPAAAGMGEVVEGMADLELNRPVGASFEYANLNSVVLGLVVEQVSGMGWEEYVETRILRPLGMDSTFTDRAAAEQAGLTATYRTFFGYPLATEAEHRDDLAASGYLYSTAGDMARYLTAYLDGGTVPGGGRVLSADGIAAMLEPATEPRSFVLQSHRFVAGYGAGWFVGPFGSATDARWHQGSLPHFTAWMVLLPETDQALVLLLNQGNQLDIAGGNAAWSRIPQGVVDLMVGAEPPESQGPAAASLMLLTSVLALATAQTWHLVRLVRRGVPDDLGTVRAAVPLMWELGLATVVLLLYPGLLGGLGWSASLAFLPDLTLGILVLCGLAIATGAVRAGLLLSRRRRGPGAVPRVGGTGLSEPLEPRSSL